MYFSLFLTTVCCPSRSFVSSWQFGDNVRSRITILCSGMNLEQSFRRVPGYRFCCKDLCFLEMKGVRMMVLPSFLREAIRPQMTLLELRSRPEASSSQTRSNYLQQTHTSQTCLLLLHPNNSVIFYYS